MLKRIALPNANAHKNALAINDFYSTLNTCVFRMQSQAFKQPPSAAKFRGIITASNSCNATLFQD